jgi:hypothetical protein
MSTSEQQAAASTPKRRWFQYSLRSLLLLMTACALACSWLVMPTVQARRFVAAARNGDCRLGEPRLSSLISEKQARLSTFSIEPLSWRQLWRGETRVLIDVPDAPEDNGPACVIGYAVSHFDAKLSTRQEKSGPGRPDWYVDRVNKWESLLSKSGQHNQGLVLEARMESGKPSSPPVLLLSVRNLGVQPVDIMEGAMEEMPMVLIRDESGKSLPMTAKGEDFHAPERLRAGSNWSSTLWPGDVRMGRSIPLADHFVLGKSGTYTVLAIKDDLISRPLTFTIPQTDVSEGIAQPSDAVPEHDHGGKDEWSRLEALAGRPQYGYALEADISPVTPGAGHLVVSLIGVGPHIMEISPFHAGVATEYRVLVRDSTGRSIAPKDDARKASAADMRVVHGGSLNVGQGNGNGVVIPLAKWFDMRSAGEYTVLVSLPTKQQIEPVWVARPIKVQVGEHLDADLPKLVKDNLTISYEALESELRASAANKKKPDGTPNTHP